MAKINGGKVYGNIIREACAADKYGKSFNICSVRFDSTCSEKNITADAPDIKSVKGHEILKIYFGNIHDDSHCIGTYDINLSNGAYTFTNGKGTNCLSQGNHKIGLQCDLDGESQSGSCKINTGCNIYIDNKYQCQTTFKCEQVNHNPFANVDHFKTDENHKGTFLLGNKLCNDSDSDGNKLSITTVNLAGTPITLTGAGSFVLANVSIMKIANASGDVATFKITTADNSDAGSDPQIAYIHVKANGDEYLENTSDAFGAMSTGQSLKFNFTYSISDGHGGTSSSTEDVTICGITDIPVNHCPIANPDHFKTDEDHSGLILLGNKLTNDTDSDANALAITAVNLAGTPKTLTGAGSFVLANVSIVKIANASGDVATFKITTADNSDAGSAPQIAYIHVKANGDEYLENTSDAFGAMSTGQSLKFNFTYTISDGHGGISCSTEDIIICGLNEIVNSLPVAVTDSFKTDEDMALNETVVPNDTPSGDGGNIWSLVGVNGGAAHGTVAMNPDGTFTYTPDANYNGNDVFTYQIQDANGDISSTTVKIEICPVNDLPVAVCDSFKTDEDMALNGTVVSNDTPSGDGGNIWSLVGVNGGAAHGAVVMNPDGTFTYTPAANYNGNDVFTYQIQDANGDISSTTVKIEICPVNDLPTAVCDSFKTDEDMALNGTVVSNDTPSGDGGNIWSLVGVNGGAAHGAVVMNPDGTFTYTPAANYNGNDVFTYQIQDANGDISSTTVKIEICPDDFAANPDTFNMVCQDLLNDTVDSSPLVLGSVLINDTSADPISVVQAVFTGKTFAGSGLSGLGTIALGDLIVVNMILGVGEIAHFSISPTGALINEAIPVAAEVIIGSDGQVTLIKNNAFDFLPLDETLTLHFSYDIAESDNLFGPSSSSTLDIVITGTDTDDVFASIVDTTVTGGLGNDILYGAANIDVAYTLNGGSGNDILIGGTNSGAGTYLLEDVSAGDDTFFAGGNTGVNYIFSTNGVGVDTLSYINIGAGVTIDLGITGVTQSTGGAGTNELFGTFQILQGSNFDDTLSFTQSDVGTSGNPVGGHALVNISSESIYGMDGNDVISVVGTATGGSGTVVGNEATVADQINAQVTLASHILEAGTGTGGQMVSIIGTATGGSADTTFGNHALNGLTAISALVDINGNALASESTTISDTLLIQAHAFGGNAGSTSWDNSTVNTGANVADGLNSKAISAQAVVDNNTLVGGVAGASMTINAEATGGNSGPALYGNQALNGAVAISAQVSVEGNHFDGFGNLAGDTLQIIALANGGDVGSGGFTGNVSGFISTPGGTAISAQALVDGNVLTEHGIADAILTINVTANGGNGNFFGNYAFDGTVISADAEVTNNTLTGGSGNDTLTLQATANGGFGPNHADVGGSVAIDAMVTVTGNTLDGGLGNDTLNLFIDANPGGSNTGGSGTEVAAQFVASNNQLLGGDGNDTLVVNNAAFLDTANTNIIDGGNDFDTLIQQISGGSLDITPAGVAGGIVQNMERVDLTGNGSNTLILDGVSIDNLNASHELFVRGDGVDTANIGAGWTFSGTITGAGAGDPLTVDAAVNFNHYTQVVGADTVHLYVDTAMIIA